MKLATPLAVAALATAASAWAATPEELIKANKCGRCHGARTSAKGPSFADLAAKYKGQAGAEARIAEMLKSGGNEHDKVAASDADLKALAAFVLATPKP